MQSGYYPSESARARGPFKLGGRRACFCQWALAPGPARATAGPGRPGTGIPTAGADRTGECDSDRGPAGRADADDARAPGSPDWTGPPTAGLTDTSQVLHALLSNFQSVPVWRASRSLHSAAKGVKLSFKHWIKARHLAALLLLAHLISALLASC